MTDAQKKKQYFKDAAAIAAMRDIRIGPPPPSSERSKYMAQFAPYHRRFSYGNEITFRMPGDKRWRRMKEAPGAGMYYTAKHLRLRITPEYCELLKWAAVQQKENPL